MRWISTLGMPVLLVLAIVATIAPARACYTVTEPGGGQRYVCPPISGPPVIVRQYGAIAYSPSSGAYGYSDQYTSRALAQNRALSECGKADCAIAAWFYNSCGALATSSNGAWGGAQGSTPSSASSSAEQRCAREGGSACVVKFTHCSGG